MPARLLHPLLICLCWCLCIGGWACAQDEVPPDGNEEPESEFQPMRVVERFPAIKDPIVLRNATKSRLRDEELVLGVFVGDAARAYPINMLTQPTREIINDKLGGTAIAATW